MSVSRKPKRINPDEVDPSVYCYDEFYDEMKNEEEKERQSETSGRDAKQGSKYIQGLLETAQRRNTEKELRKFKKFAKEREETQAQGKLNDEEVFVTSGYKKKLQEMKALEEETRRRLESEEKSSLNFIKFGGKKSSTNSKSNPTPLSTCDKTSLTVSTEKLSPKHDTGETKETSRADETSNEQLEETPLETKLFRPRELKTKEDRRTYLEQILAKRTVGRNFEEAVLRYKMRKAQAKI